MGEKTNPFSLVLEEEITKLNKVQSVFKTLLKTRHETYIPKLKIKHEELQEFIDQLLTLKDALSYQKYLCEDIKNVSVTLNNLVAQITGDSGDSPRTLQKKLSKLKTDNSHTLNLSDSCNKYSPVESVQKNFYAKPTVLKFFDIEPLIHEEYINLPKYMVGRISLDTINKFVDVFNKTVQVKYDILSKPKSTLKGHDLQLFRDYKIQETNETKGKHFVTERDIAKQLNKKNLEKSSYNLLIILRHTKRISENRYGGILRYIIL